MKRSSQFQKASARPDSKEQRTVQGPVPRKANLVDKAHVGRRSAAAPVGPLLQARQDAAAAENDVVRISRRHFATLMSFSPHARIAHLNDPELTSADRTELERSLRSALPRSAPINSTPTKLLGYLRRQFWAYGYKCAVATVLLTASGLLIGVAWHNTGQRVVGSNDTWNIEWRLPDGSIKHGAWKAGLPMIAMRMHNGKVTLRYWLNGLGYATTEVDENWLLDNSFDYVVWPTGGAGAVTLSPATR